jgi:hypothetical protein
MGSWGIAVHVRLGELAISVAVADGSQEAPSVVRVFGHRSNPGEDWPKKLESLAGFLEPELKATPPDTAVVRTFDHFKGRGLSDAFKKQLQVEGVLLQVLRSRTAAIRVAAGKDIGEMCGGNKAAVEEQASRTFGGEYAEAGAAAIAALVVAARA